MSNKLLEAAKRLYGYVEHGLSLSPLSLVAKDLQHAIAAEEQRLADEQLPATREWLTEVLRAMRGSDGIWTIGGFAEISCGDKDVWTFCAGRRLIKNPTRRQVLCLLEAMGVNK